MRVCITGPKTCPPVIGGVEVFAFEVAKRIAAHGVEVTVVSGPHEGINRDTIQNLQILRVPAVHQRHLLKISMMPGISRILTKLRPDVIHSNDATSGFLSSTLHDSTKVVYTIHGMGFAETDWPMPFRQGIKTLQATAARKARFVAATDRVTAEAYRSCRRNIAIIPPGVDTEAFIKSAGPRPEVLDRRKINLIYVGRLTRVKGFDILLESMRLLNKAILSEISLTVIGDGPLASLLTRFTDYPCNTTFLGRLPHDSLPPYFSNADILLMPSRSEGLPVSLLEAMSAELPVISTMVGGIGSYFDERHLTVIREASPEATAIAIETALGNRMLTLEKARDASRYVRQFFSWDTIAERYLEAYSEVQKS